MGVEDDVGDATGAVFVDVRPGVLFGGKSEEQAKFNCRSDLLGARREDEMVGVARPVILPRIVAVVVEVISLTDEVR
jgi:hypothetical protein